LRTAVSIGATAIATVIDAVPRGENPLVDFYPRKLIKGDFKYKLGGAIGIPAGCSLLLGVLVVLFIVVYIFSRTCSKKAAASGANDFKIDRAHQHEKINI
jgi:uncharacterized membrane protein